MILEDKKNTKKYNIVLFDYGVKFNILRSLHARNCNITVVPKNASLNDVNNLNPDGIVLSPGPGNPEFLDDSIEVIVVNFVDPIAVLDEATPVISSDITVPLELVPVTVNLFPVSVAEQ